MFKKIQIKLQFNSEPSRLNIGRPKLISTTNNSLTDNVTKINNVMIEKGNCHAKKSSKSGLSIGKPILISTSNSVLAKKEKAISNLTYRYEHNGTKLDLAPNELEWLANIYESERNR